MFCLSNDSPGALPPVTKVMGVGSSIEVESFDRSNFVLNLVSFIIF